MGQCRAGAGCRWHWADCVHSDSEGTDLLGHRLGHEDDACLRGAVRREHGETGLAGLRGHADDPATATLCDHLAARCAHAEEDAAQINSDRAVEAFVGHLNERKRWVADAGVVDGDVDAAEALDGLREESLDFGGDATSACVSILAVLAELGGRFVESGLVHVDEREFCAFPGEANGDTPTDAAAAAGNQSDTVLE
jgi:hypothetical protein